MKSKLSLLIAVLVIASMVLSACGTGTPATDTSAGETPAAEAPVYGPEPAIITGTMTYTNDFAVETYYYEQAVALTDMTAYLTRDYEWELPVNSQVLGFLDVNMDENTGTYHLALPALPEGEFHDVDNDGVEETGVQIFAVAYSPNVTGGPFSEGDDRSFGWPTYIGSLVVDNQNNDEVTGGKLVIWAPDNQQSFPSDFGADGLLLTEDDPSMPVPAGYSVIDLDQSPFAIIREEQPVVDLMEPSDFAVHDFSDLSYTEAFDQMFDFVSMQYAFNDVPGKPPVWDELYARIAPMVAEAETNNDATAFFLAIKAFTDAFHDGHVYIIDYGNTEGPYFAENFTGGYGFAMRELDDGSFLVYFVNSGGPAEAAGMQVGAVITQVDGQPTADAVAAIEPYAGPFSTDISRRYQQVRYLLRVPLGFERTFTFTNPGGLAQTVTLTAVEDSASATVSSIYQGSDPYALPVEYRILDSGVGYIKVNSNYDDLNLIFRLFERALQTFESAGVPGIIIDLRQNGGGAPLGLASYLYDQEIDMGRDYYYSSSTGQFEPSGYNNNILPMENQYSFDRMVTLVGQACASACEFEAYAFAQVPGMIVMGEYPTAGMFGDVARGSILLPEDLELDVPTGRTQFEDGSLLIEGVGVVPTVHVPISAENMLSGTDFELAAAEQAVLLPLGAGITPAAPPTFMPTETIVSRIERGQPDFLEDLARESYSNMPAPGETQTFTVELPASQEVLWAYGWCAADQATMQANFTHITVDFVLDGVSVAPENIEVYDFAAQGQYCRYEIVGLDAWSAGQYSLDTNVTFQIGINDGFADYPAGLMISHYDVYVAP